MFASDISYPTVYVWMVCVMCVFNTHNYIYIEKMCRIFCITFISNSLNFNCIYIYIYIINEHII